MTEWARPPKGRFWDFGIIGVGMADDTEYRFPHNNAVVMLLGTDRALKLPPGVTVHRLMERIDRPFVDDIAVAVKYTVTCMSSEWAAAWPDFGNTGDTRSSACPMCHRVRIYLRGDAFVDDMPSSLPRTDALLQRERM